MQKLREHGLTDNQIARYLDSPYIRSNQFGIKLAIIHRNFDCFDNPEAFRKCISELVAVGLYQIASNLWHDYCSRNKVDINDGWEPGDKWYDKVEGRLRKRLQRYGVESEPEVKTGFHRLEELFCRVLCHRPKPDPLQACKIAIIEIPATGTMLNYQREAMEKLCKVATTPEDVRLLRFELRKTIWWRRDVPGPAKKWVDLLHATAERLAYKDFKKALNALLKEDSITFDFVGEEGSDLKPPAVRIEPKEPKMIGQLDSRTVENLRMLAKKGLLVTGQQETAVAALDLLCRDRRARGKGTLWDALHVELPLATERMKIGNRVSETLHSAWGYPEV